jgi:hypothetical protein
VSAMKITRGEAKTFTITLTGTGVTTSLTGRTLLKVCVGSNPASAAQFEYLESAGKATVDANAGTVVFTIPSADSEDLTVGGAYKVSVVWTDSGSQSHESALANLAVSEGFVA